LLCELPDSHFAQIVLQLLQCCRSFTTPKLQEIKHNAKQKEILAADAKDSVDDKLYVLLEQESPERKKRKKKHREKHSKKIKISPSNFSETSSHSVIDPDQSKSEKCQAQEGKKQKRDKKEKDRR